MKLGGFFPRSLPDLSKQLRDQNNRKKYKKNEIQNFKKLFFATFGPNWRFPDMRGCAIGGFRPVESEFAVKNWKFRQLESKNWNSKFRKTKSKLSCFFLLFFLVFVFCFKPVSSLGVPTWTPVSASCRCRAGEACALSTVKAAGFDALPGAAWFEAPL